MIVHLCACHRIHNLCLMSRPFWWVDQASSGFWQASRSFLSFSWSPLHFLRITICEILVKNCKTRYFRMSVFESPWPKLPRGVLKNKKNIRKISAVSPLPLKVGCCIDLAQRQAKAQVQMPFHSKPPISCALFFFLTLFSGCFIHHGDVFSPPKGGIFGREFLDALQAALGEKKHLQKKQKDAPTSGIQVSEVVFHLIRWTLRTFHWRLLHLCLFICWACWPPNVKLLLLRLKSQAGTRPIIRYWIVMIHHDSSWMASMTLLPLGCSSKSPAPKTSIRFAFAI